MGKPWGVSRLCGEQLLATIQGVLAALQPQLVLTHHPQDDHADHRAVSFFARRACRRLSGRRPALYATLVYCRRHPWPPAGDYFYSEAIAKSFPWLKAEQFCLTERQWSVKQLASRIFTPTLSVEYVQSTMKKDEVLWRL
jgi:LmbE family N-acetylglucosaminyl deacetylase